MSKSVFALFFLINFLVINQLIAQDRLVEPLDFTCRNCYPADALVQLSRQTGINISFSDRFFSRCEPLDIVAEKIPMGRLLEQISACAKVTFKYDGSQVVFYKKNQKYNLSGYVQDAETGERLIGASIRASSEKSTGTVSNEYGFFSLRLDEDDYQIQVSYIGYRLEKLSIAVQSDRLIRFQLRPDNRLPEVIVSDQMDPETKIPKRR